MQFQFRKGLDLDMGAAPQRQEPVTAHVSTVAILGDDYPGTNFDLLVSTGDEVGQGQAVCVDRRRPDIHFVAPAAGRVAAITLGARRRLDTLEISVSGDRQQHYDPELASTDDGLRSLLMKSGAWLGFKSRPFGNIPDPNSKPAAIFVTATDSNPLAADPNSVLASQMANFQQGVDALLRLTDGLVYICQAQGAPLVEDTGRLKSATFSGPHPSGLAGTHIHHLMPASRQRSVWQIGYQEVIAIGHLLSTGRVMASRTLSLAGSGVSQPLLVTGPLGAKLTDFTKGYINKELVRLISGSVLSGKQATYLGRYALQITALDSAATGYPGRTFWQRFASLSRSCPTGATIPMESFERAFPLDLLPVPLMRALAVGDIETAERLGCLELLEDDLALLSCLCPSGSDYGALLSEALKRLADEAVAI